MLDIAVLTCDALLHPDPHSFYNAQVIYEESIMLDYFKRHGVKAERISWSDTNVDWSKIGCGVFRSTWDYLEKPGPFNEWLEHVRDKLPLVNPYEVIKWNQEKRYLLELAEKGVMTVPTLFVERSTQAELERLFSELACDELVIKPAMSAGGVDTFRVSKAGAKAFEPKFQSLIAAKTMMVQPFLPAIVEQGELSLIVIDGRFTHAVRKLAKAGEFRVQDDHGGYAVAHTASEVEKRIAEEVVRACPEKLHYARVDVIDVDGLLIVMEVELFEPELLFRFNRLAGEKLAASVMRRLGR